MPHIYGNRLRLRAAERSDIPLFLKWINDPEVTEHLLLRFPMSAAEEENWYENMIRRPAAEHVHVIEVDLADKKSVTQNSWRAIGNTYFIDVNEIDRCAEIGILIGDKQYWNKGYGTETMQTMLRYGFETLNFHRIWLQVFVNNKRGIRAYEKAGFIHEGVFREGNYQSGKYCDVMIMSVLRQEWDLITQKKGE